MAAGGWGSKGLPFLAVGRVERSVRLAYYINTDTEESQKATMDVFTKLLAAAASKLSPGQRTRLQWNDGSVCCLMDPKGELLYCVVTSLLTYPERLAYQLLYDLQAQVATVDVDIASPNMEEDGLMKKLEPKMKDLVKYYEDSSNFPQFALGMSRDSVASTQSSNSLAGGGADGAGSRGKKIAAGAVVVLLIAGGIGAYAAGLFGGSSTTQTQETEVLVAEVGPQTALARNIGEASMSFVARTGREVARNMITMMI